MAPSALLFAVGCATAPLPEATAPPARPSEPSPPVEEPAPEGERIAVPGWVAVLIDSAAEVEDQQGLERLAAAASTEVAGRMLEGVTDADLDEARLAIMMLMLIQWGEVIGEEEAFGAAEFKRQIVLTTLLEFERSLRGRGPNEQLARLRCDLLVGQLTELRRLAFASAGDLFEERIEPEAAAAVGAGIRERLDQADRRSKELAGTCQESQGASAALANAYIDAGYLLSADPCDVLTWDVYMLILGADEQLPEPERVLGPGCAPKVLVFH
jgi:hypothetical protein